MILEDIDDYSSAQPKVDDDLNLIIKTYERKNSLGKMKVDDSSEKKLERQNSRKKNLLENSAQSDSRKQAGVLGASEEPPANLDRQNRFSEKPKIKIPVSVAKQLGIAKNLQP